MIQSTGNNFGAGVIQFKDYQSEHEIVLNGSFEYNDTNVLRSHGAVCMDGYHGQVLD